MDYQKPSFSRTKVDRCARMVVGEAELDDRTRESIAAVISNWRSAHAFPLNTITTDLKKKSKRIEKGPLVVQRLKRNRSILAKLYREESMRLTQMQDIGGCRVVLESNNSVEELRQLYRRSRAEHKFVAEYDYISSPKVSGYRGLHLVYSYRSKTKPEYNNLLCEIQIRTLIQHAWATAVETVGAVLDQSLKASEGQAEWLAFFKHAAAAFSFMEGSANVPELNESQNTLRRRLKEYMRKLEVEETLNKYRYALRATEDSSVKNAGYFLLVLRPETSKPETPTLEIFAFRKGLYAEAYEQYLNYERQIPNFYPDPQLPLFSELADYSGAQAVLVGAESFRSLRQSYPNYFLDTEMFIASINKFIMY